MYSAAASGGVYTIGKSIASALFVSTLASSEIPYLFLIPGLLTLPALLAYNALSARIALRRAVFVSTAILVVLILGLRVVLATPVAGRFAVLATLFAVADLASVLVILQFWTYAGEVFDVREARRLFGVIAVGGTLSTLVAALVLHPVTAAIGLDNMLLLVAASLIVCIACSQALESMRPHDGGPRTPRTPRSTLARNVRLVRGSPLLVSIGVANIGVAALATIGTYQFFLALNSSYGGRGQSLVTFLAAFQFWSALLAVAVQSQITGRVMARLGVVAASLVYPASMVTGSVASLVTGGSLGAVTVLRGSAPVLKYTINQAATNAFYLPVPGELGRRAREVNAAAYSLAVASCGALFIGLAHVPGWGYAQWAYTMFAIATGVVVMLLRARRQYIAELSDSVASRRLGADSQPLDLLDETTAAVLVKGLASPSPASVLHVLELLATAPSNRWNADLLPLLVHPSAAVRVAALDLLGRSGGDTERAAVAACLLAEDSVVRAAAASALCQLGGGDAVVGTLIEDRDPRIRAAAAIGFARSRQGREDKARAILQSLLESDEPGARLAAARAVGTVRLVALSAALRPLLDDEDPAVRRAAVEAAGRLEARELIGPLIAALNDSDVASSAVDALAERAASHLGVLAAALADPTTGTASSVRILRALERVGTPAAARAALTRLDDPDTLVRGAAQLAVARMRTRDPALEVDRAAISRAVDRELRECFEWLAIRADLGAVRPALVDESLAERTAAALQRVVTLLAILNPHQRVLAARGALRSDRRGTRALAAELVVQAAQRRHRDLIERAIESPPDAAVAAAAKQLGVARAPASERVEKLAAGPDPWLAACARRGIAESGGAPAPAAEQAELDRVLLLKSAQPFGAVAAEELLALARLAVPVTFASGTAIVEEGDTADCLYVIVDGSVAARVAGVGEVSAIGPGEVLGEMAIVSRRRRATCVALSDVNALRIGYDALVALLTDRPRIGRGMIATLIGRTGALLTKGRRDGVQAVPGAGVGPGRSRLPDRDAGQPATISTVERVLLLRAADVFGSLASEELVALARVAEPVELAAGQRLVVEAAIADSLFVIVDGRVAVSSAGLGQVGSLGPGDVVGEMAIFSRTRTATCTASSRLVALRIDYDAFLELLDDHPQLAFGLITTLVGRMDALLARHAAANSPAREVLPSEAGTSPALAEAIVQAGL